MASAYYCVIPISLESSLTPKAVWSRPAQSLKPQLCKHEVLCCAGAHHIFKEARPTTPFEISLIFWEANNKWWFGDKSFQVSKHFLTLFVARRERKQATSPPQVFLEFTSKEPGQLSVAVLLGCDSCCSPFTSRVQNFAQSLCNVTNLKACKNRRWYLSRTVNCKLQNNDDFWSNVLWQAL